MHPVLWRWGSHLVYSYSVLMGLGILLGVACAEWQGRRAGYRGLQVLDGTLWVLIGGLIGARAAYVIPNWADYVGRPAALLQFWGGGLVFQGGLVGGLIALLLYSLYCGLPLLRLADVAVAGVALGQAVGWVGALMHGANYGVVVRSSLSLWLPDIYGVYGPRFPTQLVAALGSGGLLIGLLQLSRRRLLDGMLFWIYLLGNGGVQFLLEFTRADESPYVGSLRVTQVAELAQALIAAAVLLYYWRRYVIILQKRDTDAHNHHRPGTDQPISG
jgi:phosphatidylglycerol---prolipoprotein diacylglyceryl transferase